MSINLIRHELRNLKGKSILAKSIRLGANNDLIGTIKMIIAQAGDKYSRPGLVKIIGDELLRKIETL